MKEALLKRDKRILFVAVILMGIIGLGLVITTAYAAEVKYRINETLRENEILRGEIENLKVRVNEANNIQTLEIKAQTELGMIYPAPEQFVFIAEEEEPPADFAMLIRTGAYQ